MDWTHVIIIIGVFAAFFVYVLTKVDKCATKEELSKVSIKIDLMNTSLNTKIDLMNTNIISLIMDIRDRLTRIETKMESKVFHIQEEKPKKKAKGE